MNNSWGRSSDKAVDLSSASPFLEQGYSGTASQGCPSRKGSAARGCPPTTGRCHPTCSRRQRS